MLAAAPARQQSAMTMRKPLRPSDRCGWITAAKTGLTRPAEVGGKPCRSPCGEYNAPMPARKPTPAHILEGRSALAEGEARDAADRTPAKPAPRPPRRPKPVDRATVAEVFRRFRAANPEPKGELEHVNPYTLLVAVVLSAQSTDAGVNKATRELFAVADTPQKMLALGEDGVREHIKTHRTSSTPRRRTSSRCRAASSTSTAARCRPRSRSSRPCPASAARPRASSLNIAFGEPPIAVDTHIFRVANRIPLVATDNAARHAGAARAHRAGRSSGSTRTTG